MRRLTLALSLLALVLPGPAQAYQWPFKPFNKQHPIRGYFNDPRVGEGGGTGFHFGIDIHAADFTPVYSVSGGKAKTSGQSVTVRVSSSLSFGYWHVLPRVLNGNRVRKGQVIGWTHPYWDHLHFSELRDGLWVNPLRSGALAPYLDDTKPAIEGITFALDAKTLEPTALSGAVDVILNCYDTSPQPIAPGRWGQAKLAPAYIRWRVLRGEQEIVPWEVSFDARYELLPAFLYDLHYAPGTRQNKAWAIGRLLLYAAHGFDTRQLPNGEYAFEIEVSDLGGNTTARRATFTVLNPLPPAP